MNILVVTGSRALDVCHRPRRWVRMQLISAVTRLSPGLVVHGGARGPDSWAEELAQWAGLPRVVFALGGKGLPHLRLPGGGSRPLKHAERYAYSDPLGRNEVMMRWGADRAAEGHAVYVLGLRAPWSNTRGTASALRHAADFLLPFEDHEAPADAWPEEDPAVEGANGA